MSASIIPSPAARRIVADADLAEAIERVSGLIAKIERDPGNPMIAITLGWWARELFRICWSNEQ